MSVTKMREADEGDFLDAMEQIIVGKDENAEWADDDMREALKMLYRGKSYNDMEDEMEERVSRGQVSSQVERVVERLPDDGPRQSDGSSEGDVVFQEPGPVAAEDFEEFLDSVGSQVGMNDDFMSRMVYDVERLQQLPDPQSFGNAIDTSKSGVANGEQIRWCVDHYEDFLDKFSREASPHVVNSVVPQQYQSRNQQGGYGQQPAWGSGGGTPAGGQQAGGYGGQQQTPQGGPQAGALASVVETQKELMREIKELKQGGGGGGGGAKDQIQEVVEVQQAIDELQGGGSGGDDERTKLLIQELRSLKQEMSGGGAQAQAGDPVKNALLRAAQSGEQDLSEVVDVVEKMESEDDPEVAVKKLEKEQKELELEHQKEKTEKQMEAFESITTTLASEFSGKIAEAAAGGQQQAQPAQNQQAQQPPQQQAAQQQRQQRQQQPTSGQQQQTPAANQQQTPSPQQDTDVDFEVTESAPDGGSAPAETPPSVDDVSVDEDQPAQADNEMPCPNCGDMIELNPATPGMECENCDYSVQPCGTCETPIEILPPGDHETFICPECESAARPEQSEEEDIGCIDCDWEGAKEEVPMEGAVCGGCGAVYPVQRPGAEGGE